MNAFIILCTVVGTAIIGYVIGRFLIFLVEGKKQKKKKHFIDELLEQ